MRIVRLAPLHLWKSVVNSRAVSILRAPTHSSRTSGVYLPVTGVARRAVEGIVCAKTAYQEDRHG
jgi:hypothetical protein